MVEVPDARIDRLVELFKPKKTIYTTFEFTDIAGLVKGASKGEGLGNQFLSNIRLCDAICHVCLLYTSLAFINGRILEIYERENFKRIVKDFKKYTGKPFNFES